MCVEDLKFRLARDADTAPRRLAAPEREARYSEQKSRLVGLDHTGECEPSHQLVDLAMAQYEENAQVHSPQPMYST